jgi:hypothetical protein
VVTVATTEDAGGSVSSSDRIQDALAAAYESGAKYDVAVQLQAAGHDANAEARRIEFQQHVLYSISVLRPYLVREMPGYWEGESVDIDTADTGFDIDGLGDLMQFKGAVSDESTFADGQPTHSQQPTLLPPPVLRSALDCIGEVAYELGFMPTPGYDYE